MNSLHYLDWPAPSNVKACFTLRQGGVSESPYDSFNTALHVGDNIAAVMQNRALLSTAIGQSDIHWLEQVHSTVVVDVGEASYSKIADAANTQKPNQVCCVMTADCLPVFFCDRKGKQVAIAHAGWRGLCHGILQNTISCFEEADELMAYLGPAISQTAFEVGSEVRSEFIQHYPQLAIENHFMEGKTQNKWMGDLYGIAREILRASGIQWIYGGNFCTFSESDNFFSYRRDGTTGRITNVIWFE